MGRPCPYCRVLWSLPVSVPEGVGPLMGEFSDTADWGSKCVSDAGWAHGECQELVVMGAVDRGPSGAGELW